MHFPPHLEIKLKLRRVWTHLHKNVDKSTVQAIPDVPLHVWPVIGHVAYRQQAQRPEENAQTRIVISYPVPQVEIRLSGNVPEYRAE